MDPKTSLASAAFLIEMINIDYKLFHWLHRCGPTSTPSGLSSGNMWTTSSISSCQEVSSRCTRWCDSQESSAADCRRVAKDCKLCPCSSSQVTFTRTRYHDAVKRWHWQDKVRHFLLNLIYPACYTCFFLGYFTTLQSCFVVTLKSCSNDQPSFKMRLSLGKTTTPINKTSDTLLQM